MCTFRSATLALVTVGLLCVSGLAQSASDVNRLMHPEVAEAMGLEDGQRSQIQALRAVPEWGGFDQTQVQFSRTEVG